LTALIKMTGVGLYLGRGISFLCAATFTWHLNRRFTFAQSTQGRRATQWLRYLGANALGAIANLGMYGWLVSTFHAARTLPALAVAAGSLSGLLFNFTLSRLYVFRANAGNPGR
jgi:putative flippase GtrA